MGLSLTFGLCGPEHMTTHHLPHRRRHDGGFPWLLTQTLEDSSKIHPPRSLGTSTCSPETSCSSSLISLFRDGKKGRRRACPGALQTTLPPPTSTQQARAARGANLASRGPIISVTGPHTHSGFIRNRPGHEQAGHYSGMFTRPSACPLNTRASHQARPWSHLRSGQATANALLPPASHHHHGNGHPGRPRRPERLMLSPDPSRVFPELPWLHYTRRSHTQPFL